uniref:p31 beta subunit n=1 Tax=Daboia russelii russelii TaxID=31159 RepID=K9JDK6_DABRR|nr:P31 beta subunit [Daboia russelii russelii]
MGRFIFVSFSLLVVFLPLSGTEAGFSCPNGWSSFGQHCYKVIEPLKNWTDAEKFCREQHKGSHLASIHSSEEEAFVSKVASKVLKFGSVWIGLNDPWHNCNWEWSDNARFDYKAMTRRPYCTVMVLKPDRIFWFNRGCEKFVSFVCKFLA